MGNLIIAEIKTDIDYLRTKSSDTTLESLKEINFIGLIKYAMEKAWILGYGLAGIQIGLPINAGWFWLPSKLGEMSENELLVNPKIIEKSELIMIPNEGCLSLPNKLITTERYNNIVYENDGEERRASGLKAQIIQHEIDHMNGILMIDREYKKGVIGRNEKCWCGSGKKHKRCHGK